MNVVSRGVRNAFRNNIRTFSIVVILGLSIGMALAMLIARATVTEKITDVKTSIGNTISISPAGYRGFQGGGEALTVEQLATVANLPNVTSVINAQTEMLTSESTNLVSSIEAGALGRRGAENSGIRLEGGAAGNGMNFQAQGSSTDGSTSTPRIGFTPPVIATGINDISDPSALGVDQFTITSGEVFDASIDKNSAVLGIALAEKNLLNVGSSFYIYGELIEVVGIFDSGNTFTNNGVIMPLSAVQRLSGQESAVTSSLVKIDSVDNIDTVLTGAKEILGTSADVVSSQENAKNAVTPLENVKQISLYSMIGALVAGAVIILLAMMMIVRERRREIGIMKAIGSSNAKTVVQFMVEAMTLTSLALVVGLLFGAVGAQPITKTLVNNSSSESTTTGSVSGGGRFLKAGGVSSGTLSAARDVQTSIGFGVIGSGAIVALVIAAVGSAFPAYIISKVRPSEVLRSE